MLAICAPCQPFTKITKIKLSEARIFTQARDKNLLLTTLNIIHSLKPDAILCENVEGISSGGDVIAEFNTGLDGMGYSFDWKVIDAANFGVPQHRNRTIGMGSIRKKVRLHPDIPERNPRLKKAPSVQKIIGHLPPLVAGDVHPPLVNHVTRNLSDLNLKRISCAPPGESNRYLKDTPYGDLSLECHRRLSQASFSGTYTRMHPDRLSPTITTKFLSITNGRFGHYDSKQNRGISLKEGALLQTFPRSYHFKSNRGIGFLATLIGNAVPPKLARFFGAHILKHLNG